MLVQPSLKGVHPPEFRLVETSDLLVTGLLVGHLLQQTSSALIELGERGSDNFSYIALLGFLEETRPPIVVFPHLTLSYPLTDSVLPAHAWAPYSWNHFTKCARPSSRGVASAIREIPVECLTSPGCIGNH